jgi:hypothetical protein
MSHTRPTQPDYIERNFLGRSEHGSVVIYLSPLTRFQMQDTAPNTSRVWCWGPRIVVVSNFKAPRSYYQTVHHEIAEFSVCKASCTIFCVLNTFPHPAILWTPILTQRGRVLQWETKSLDLYCILASCYIRLAYGWQHHGRNWHKAPASPEYTITPEDGRVRPKHVDD